MPKVPHRGETAPDFCLADTTGTGRSLSDLASDRPLVLLFYRGWWRPFCHRQLADYRDRYAQIRAAGASVAAVSVDTAAQSEALRAQLSLPFPILCDTERHVIREWGLLNARERRGIAKPSVFVIGTGLMVRYAAIDTVASRVTATEILSVLDAGRDAPQIQRKTYLATAGRLDTGHSKQLSKRLTETNDRSSPVRQSMGARVGNVLHARGNFGLTPAPLPRQTNASISWNPGNLRSAPHSGHCAAAREVTPDCSSSSSSPTGKVGSAQGAGSRRRFSSGSVRESLRRNRLRADRQQRHTTCLLTRRR